MLFRVRMHATLTQPVFTNCSPQEEGGLEVEGRASAEISILSDGAGTIVPMHGGSVHSGAQVTADGLKVTAASMGGFESKDTRTCMTLTDCTASHSTAGQ